MKKWYAANRDREREKSRKRYREKKKFLASRIYLDSIRSRGCEMCGELDVRCLQFHHIDPSTKEFSVGSGTHSMESVRLEVSKCVVLCANCHCKLHYDAYL